MHPLAFLDGCRPVADRPGQRMPEQDPVVELGQPLVGGGGCSGRGDAEPPGRSPHECGVTGRVRCRDQQQPTRLVRAVRRSALEVCLHGARNRRPARDREPAGQLVRRAAPGQLQQGQRVASCLGHDLVPYPLVQRPGEHGVEQRPRVGPSSPVTSSCGSLWRSSSSTRVAKIRPSDSAPSRRATKARTCRDAWSSHWWSSMRHTNGCFSATSDSRPKVARPTRKRSGAGPAATPNTVSRASR